jgi:hypothetical protein
MSESSILVYWSSYLFLCMYGVYIQVENYSAIKKKKIMLFLRNWMDLEIIGLNEVSQTQLS